VFTKSQEKLALSLLHEKKELPNVIVLKHKDFHEGVVGLIAGKIKEKYNRPTIILAPHEKIINGEKVDVVKGSARSIEGFHIKEAFDEITHLTLGHGGHAMAGGLSIKASDFDEFDKEINKLANKYLTKEDYVKKVYLDSVVSDNEIDYNLIDDIEALKPYGMGFSKPKFAINNFIVSEVNLIGKDKSHLKLKSEKENSLLLFNMAEKYEKIGSPEVVKLVGTPYVNIFNGRSSIQVIVENDYIFRG
ncbi:MAG: DHHA1 domain-containing protein, partial [Peptostreptococcaceae bacterium]